MAKEKGKYGYHDIKGQLMKTQRKSTFLQWTKMIAFLFSQQSTMIFTLHIINKIAIRNQIYWERLFDTTVVYPIAMIYILMLYWDLVIHLSSLMNVVSATSFKFISNLFHPTFRSLVLVEYLNVDCEILIIEVKNQKSDHIGAMYQQSKQDKNWD